MEGITQLYTRRHQAGARDGCPPYQARAALQAWRMGQVDSALVRCERRQLPPPGLLFVQTHLLFIGRQQQFSRADAVLADQSPKHALENRQPIGEFDLRGAKLSTEAPSLSAPKGV